MITACERTNLSCILLTCIPSFVQFLPLRGLWLKIMCGLSNSYCIKFSAGLMDSLAC